MEITNKTNHEKYIEPIDSTLDREWLKSTFNIADRDIVNGDSYKKWIRVNRYYSSADYKFTSTSPGSSISCNPRPQFTRYCDIRSKGKIGTRPDINLLTPGYKDGLGMGRYYSEAIDDNQQRVYFRFGIPKYMSMLVWTAKAFDIDKAIMQGRGTITSALLTAIELTASFFALIAAPILAVGMFALKALTSSSRYYSLQDTMYVYWATVENILNTMVARRTMLPYILTDFVSKLDNKIGREQRPTEQFISDLNKLLPNIIDAETGRISVFAIALRAQATYNKVLNSEVEANAVSSVSADFTGYQDKDDQLHDTDITNKSGELTFFTNYLFKSAYKIFGKADGDNKKPSGANLDSLYTDDKGNPIDVNLDSSNPKDNIDKKIIENAEKNIKKWDTYKAYILAELSEGAAFAVFNVDNTGSIGESFSNSFGSNPIENIFNSATAAVRNVSSTVTSIGQSIPIVGDALKLAADAGAKFLSGATFGIANPLLALAYGVNITMPKVWESSSASLPRASYKMKLISPYGNAYSQLFNMYLPLAMILAGSLPRATGLSSYMSPFFCQLFDRGRTNIQLGMIESVSITRGTSNLAFSRSGQPNAIDVDITVANLDEIISVDVNSNGVLGKIGDVFNTDFTDTPFMSYINTITGVDVYTQIYALPSLRLKIAERYATLKSIASDEVALGAMTANRLSLMIPIVNGDLRLFKGLICNNALAIEDLIRK